MSKLCVSLSNGLGNNLFQYIYGRLWANRTGRDLTFRLGPAGGYALDEFQRMGIKLALGQA